MELNYWNEDFSLGLDNGPDMFDQLNGPFGDPKLSGQPMSDRGCLTQDALFAKDLDDLYQEDVLGTEWMESSDVDSYLDAISGAQDKETPLEPFLFESPFIGDTHEVQEEKPWVLSGFSLFEPIKGGKHQDFTIFEAVREHKPLIFSDFSLFEADKEADPPTLLLSPETISANVASSKLKTEFDAAASPPSSPAQVAPVISIDIASYDCHSGSPESYQTVESADTTLESFSDRDISFDDLSYSGIEITHPAKSVNISLYSSTPTLHSYSSSIKKSCSGIIRSSPELYKVISASAVELEKKSSGSKSRCGKSTSSVSRKSKTAAQPVPEHVIVEQLDKKDRKKLQNKNAAIRYRMKKKEEAFEIKSEVQILGELNSKLKVKVEDLQREIKYMKNLMDDVRKAKGLL
ncbi:cyclic AMP-dependent transcription factor ATF-4-like [Biomphalaria glabrata]|uniref:Cyclic AMP-dependent transcription factor ATF-4-like n=1 Tax=Biomphalaria glabrata TaxID=6526 RepID=E6Y9P9_BIOGL|nr:cyclic AMP-dependent transcription factor ATF-4-like [Biomphalaria glabrata]ACZ51334.1 cAMP response element-binding protein [Biomphalaria glabrata]